MRSIFENVSLIGDTPSYKSVSFVNEMNIDAVYTEGQYINDCTFTITEQMIQECGYNVDLIRQAAILEGAKIDWALQNWFKEGKDYKGLKAEVKAIVKANDLDKSELKSKGKGFMHTCKRILQILEDITVVTNTIGIAGSAAAGAVALGKVKKAAAAFGVVAKGLNPAMLIVTAIISIVVNFIINRLFRLLWDSIEFNAIKDDAEECVSQLRSAAKKADNKKQADHLNAEADKLEEAIKKYSKKNKKNDDDDD